MRNKKIILFDFDGVITDSYSVAFKTSQFFDPSLTEEKHKERFKGNVNEAVVENKDRLPIEIRNIQFFDLYVPEFLKCPVFPGMLDVIKKLSENYILIIVSSTISSPIREYLIEHNVLNYFSEVMGNDIHHSKVEKIKMVFEKYGVAPEDCLFITDTVGDLCEANKTGVNAIAVTWGFHNLETLIEGNPIAFVDKPVDLPIRVDEYFNSV